MEKLQVGQRIGVFEALKQPHDWYAPLGTQFAAILKDDRLFPGKICEYSDSYYWNESGEIKKIGCLIIKKLKSLTPTPNEH